VDSILDTAGQKGTGKWASVVSLDLGVPLTLISEAVYARYLTALISNMPREEDRHGLLCNLFEEMGLSEPTSVPHTVVYANMLSRLGLNDGPAPLPTTQALSETMLDCCQSANFMIGLGALCLGAEAIVPELYGSIVQGFLSVGETLDNLVERVNAGALSKAHIEDLAPFLSKATLERLVFETADGKIDLSMLRGLAPFLSREVLDRMVDQAAEGNLEASELVELAPFLSREAIQKVLQYVAAGSINPEVIVELAPFIDKQTLGEMIRASMRAQGGEPPAAQ
jgi:hypothetical protein